MDSVKDIIASKGLIIAILTALTKGVFQIRKREFSLIIFLCDLFLALPVGYVWREMGKVTEINEWFLLFTTIVMSGNAFTVLLLVFNPEFAKKILSKWILVNEQNISPKK